MENCKYYTKHLETIKAYISCLYSLEDCICGGLLHVMIDDGNIDDHSINWTLEQCQENPEYEESEIGKLICKEYLKLSMPQRRLLSYEYLAHPGCCESCENCYIENGDHEEVE